MPNQVICYSDQFDDANMAGQMRTRVTLREVSCGTEISIVQEGIPEMIPTEMCYLGWQESLEQLKRLVEPQPAGLKREGPAICNTTVTEAQA